MGRFPVCAATVHIGSSLRKEKGLLIELNCKTHCCGPYRTPSPSSRSAAILRLETQIRHGADLGLKIDRWAAARGEATLNQIGVYLATAKASHRCGLAALVPPKLVGFLGRGGKGEGNGGEIQGGDVPHSEIRYERRRSRSLFCLFESSARAPAGRQAGASHGAVAGCFSKRKGAAVRSA